MRTICGWKGWAWTCGVIATRKKMKRSTVIIEKGHGKHGKGHHSHDQTKVEIGEASGSFEAGFYEDSETGATMGGVKMHGKVEGVEITKKTHSGRASGSFLTGKGSAEVGYESDPRTGRTFAGGKVKGRVAGADVSADTPIGRVSGSFMEAEGSAQVGYESNSVHRRHFCGCEERAAKRRLQK